MGPGNIESYFSLEPSPRSLAQLETPVPIVDLDVVERNLRRWQARCDRIGLDNRPHVKTHKMTALALFQLSLGAVGISVQKLGEAEVMARAGVSDMLVAFNIVGQSKLDRLTALARSTRTSVVADNPEVIEGISSAGAAAGRRMEVLVECDTGGGRNGVQSPGEAAQLASLISRSPHLAYKGLMTFPARGDRQKMAGFLAEARSQTDLAGCASRCISVGGTPEMWRSEGLDQVTEYRAGTYIFNDLSVISSGSCSEDDCAVDILATVVSTPAANRAIVDAGSKSLTTDQLGETGYGRLRGCESRLYALTEEHGMVDTRPLDRKLKIGELLRIIPNHVCPVINLFDRVAVMKGGCLMGYARVDARGMVT